MSKSKKTTLLFLFMLFVLIRAFQEELFYDPFIGYFKEGSFSLGRFPNYSIFKLVLSYLFRYGLNMAVSLLMINVIYENKLINRFTIRFYIMAVVFMLPVFVIITKAFPDINYIFPFYIRRFIIHPLFILILIPFFQIQKRNSVKRNN